MVNMAINNLKAKIVSVILVSVFLNQLTPANVIAAGRANAAATNTIRSGNGVPAASLGVDGDFYIDLKTMNFYGPKANKHCSYVGLFVNRSRWLYSHAACGGR
jgi:hypothetical protein